MRFLLATTSALATGVQRTSRRTFLGELSAAAARNPRRKLSTNRPVRWGILSAGKISSDFVQAIAITEGAETHAIAARSLDKASSFATRHSIPTAHGSYDELLADPNVDVVYVGSIADEHANLAARSLLAGKPTVVEKPLTTSLEQTEELVGLARETGTFLMEGMWTRCFPAMRKVRDIIARGTIGSISVVQGDFGWSTEGSPYPSDRIWNPQSGGMTLDIGMYMAQLGQVAFPNAEVDAVQAMGTTRHGVDHTALANIMYSKMMVNGDDEGGIDKGMLQFYVTGTANTEERVVIQGTKGRIVLEEAHIPKKVQVFKDEGRNVASEEVFEYPLPDDSHAEWNYPGSIGFTHQISEIGKALRAGERECRHFTLNDSLQVATVLDEILAQVRPAGQESSKSEMQETASSTESDSDSDSDAEMSEEQVASAAN